MTFSHHKGVNLAKFCIYTKMVYCSGFFVGGVGGGSALAAVTFLCDTSWENSIFLSRKIRTFWEQLGKGYKIASASNTSVSS